ncbi:MAG: DUF4388 domain-containing protein [Vicinamibacteria bacterium]|nr:DUF4388 domain-containing protein [Vicinamibacteria bacterium]
MASPEPNARAAEPEDLAIRGDIETASMPELIRSLLTSNETGVLTIRNSEFTKSLYIQEGKIVYAASTDPDERLGENLLLRGKITARQYVDASKQIRPGRKLGAILVEMEALEPDELIPAVEQQVKDIVMELFQWTRGEYEFLIKHMDPANVLSLNMSTENLILEGIRRCQSWSRVFGGIVSLEAVPFPFEQSDAFYRLDLTDEEQEVLSYVNGRSSIEQICQMSYLTSFETCRILWALMLVGVVRRGAPGDVTAVTVDYRQREAQQDLEEIVEKFNQMFGRIYTFLRGRLGDDVDAFMDMTLEEVSRQYGTLFAGVDLKSYGRADFEQMLANVADLLPEKRKDLIVTGLNELVYVIQLAVRTRYGQQEEAVISGIIKDGFRKLAAR